jgi:branched-chain amino acid transport system permease protein
MEWLRFVEYPMTIGTMHIPGIAGLRMVIFSAILVAVIIFYQQGLLGKREFSWEGLVRLSGRFKSKGGKGTPGPQKEVA